jgi:hypothetical protein
MEEAIKSEFRFEGYKIDTINFETIPEVSFLEISNALNPKGWKFEIAIRPPLFLKNEKKYVGGLDMSIKYPIPEATLKDGWEEKFVSDETQKAPPVAFTDFVKLEIGIAGIFSAEEGKFPQKTEENLVKIQIPMLLFSYLRSAVTSIMAQAGLGSFIFPLINVHEVAKKANFAIKEIVFQPNPSSDK